MNAIRMELERIRLVHGGILRPCDVVQEAKDPENPLHSRFQWDDAKAAEQHRLWQARELITVYVEVLPGAKRETTQIYVSMCGDRREVGGGYRHIRDVLADPEARARFLDEGIAELRRSEAKYGKLRELAEVFAALREVESASKKKKAA